MKKSIAILLLLPLILGAQSYFPNVADKVEKEFFASINLNGIFGIDQNNVTHIYQYVGGWSYFDFELIRDKIPFGSQFFHGVERDSILRALKKQTNSDRLILWNLSLSMPFRFIDYYSSDQTPIWILSAPLFFESNSRCLLKLQRHNSHRVIETNILSFKIKKGKWVLDSQTIEGIGQTSYLTLPFSEIRSYEDSISLAIFPRCDTICGEIFNCYDTLGQRQGYWKESRPYMTICGKDRCADGYYHIVYEGHYSNNKRVGMWYFYDYNFNSRSNDTIKTIQYEPNGYIHETNIKKNIELRFSSDSIQITGSILYKQHTLILKCENKECTLYIGESIELNKFSFSDFDEELYRIELGMYDRLIYLAD